MRIHVVHQEAEGSETLSALETVILADQERSALLAEEAALQESGSDDVARLAEISDQLNAIDAYSAESRAASILAGLQFTPEMQSYVRI